MTKAELSLSYETVRHLDAWLARFLLSNEPCNEIRRRMIELVAEDEDYWTAHSWSEVYNAIAWND